MKIKVFPLQFKGSPRIGIQPMGFDASFPMLMKKIAILRRISRTIGFLRVKTGGNTVLVAFKRSFAERLLNQALILIRQSTPFATLLQLTYLKEEWIYVTSNLYLDTVAAKRLKFIPLLVPILHRNHAKSS